MRWLRKLKDVLGNNADPAEIIKFVENNIARSWFREPESGEAYSLDSIITRLGGYCVISEIKALLKANAPHIGSDYKEWRELVPMANGVYDIKSGTLAPYDPEKLVPYRIDLNYVPSDEIIGEPAEFLNKIFLKRQRLIDVFCCFLGISLSSWQGAQRCVMGLGRSASNGKSTLSSLIKQVVGEKHVADEQLSDVFANGHGKTALEGKLVNIGDDLNKNGIRNQGDFNSLITSKMIRIEPKNVNSYYAQNMLTNWFWGNVLPRIGEADGAAGVLRRLVILSMDAHFDYACKEDNYEEGVFVCDPDAINHKFKVSDLEALAGYSLKLLTKEYNTRSSVIDPCIPEIQAELKKYYADLDSAFNYLEENGYIESPEKLHKQNVADIYKEYVDFVGAGGKPLAIKGFGMRLRNHIKDIDTTSFRGNKVYVYKNADEGDTK